MIAVELPEASRAPVLEAAALYGRMAEE